MVVGLTTTYAIIVSSVMVLKAGDIDTLLLIYFAIFASNLRVLTFETKYYQIGICR